MRISLFLCGAMLLWSCAKPASYLADGDPSRGADAIYRYGCGSCHSIRGLKNAHGLVGPPLDNIRERMFIAGMLQNNPSNLKRWIRDPKAVNEKTAMPKLGVTAEDAMDIAAYLYSK